MAINNEDFKNFLNSSKNICNFKNIPTSWQKFGEVFCKFEQPIFVCSICLKNAENINTAYTTNDGSTFWWHVQQHHISVEYAELENVDTDSVDSEISYGEIITRDNELVEFDDNKMRENSVKFLEEFHDHIVNGETGTDQCVDVTKESTQSVEQNTKENSAKEDIKPNVENKFINYSNLNYYYDENETYTISDDDDDDEDVEDSKFPITCKDVLNNLSQNEMIEISDDELSEDNIETCPSTLISIGKENECVEESNHTKTHKGINYTEENTECRTNFPYGVPTPDISPSESLTGQQNNTNFNCTQLNYNLTVYSECESIKQTRKYSKNTVKQFLAFQCELCGVRTANVNTMKIHLQRLHLFVLNQFGTTEDCHQHYRQLQPPVKSNQRNGLCRKTLKRPFKCKSCKRRTLTLKSMERHQQLYHGPQANLLKKQCNICHKRILRETFDVHMKSHFSAGFNCNYCGVVYKQKAAINNHIRQYHADSNYLAAEYFPQCEKNPPINYIYPEHTSHAHNESQPIWTHFTNIIN